MFEQGVSASREVFQGNEYREVGQEIRGEKKDYWKRMSKEKAHNLQRAIDEVGVLLADGKWHWSTPADEICKKYDVELNEVLDELYAAYEDRGVKKYICIVKEWTPDRPPDVKGKENGMD